MFHTSYLESSFSIFSVSFPFLLVLIVVFARSTWVPTHMPGSWTTFRHLLFHNILCLFVVILIDHYRIPLIFLIPNFFRVYPSSSPISFAARISIILTSALLNIAWSCGSLPAGNVLIQSSTTRHTVQPPSALPFRVQVVHPTWSPV